MNMVCCLTAKKLGIKHTIARIRDTQYASELAKLQNDLELDMVISPEMAAAGDIARLVQFPSAANIETFANGRVEMVELKVKSGLPIINLPLKKIAADYPFGILIGAVQRAGEIYIPDGNFTVREGDMLYVIGRHSMIYAFCRKLGIYKGKINAAMLIGGGRISYYLAKYLDKSRIEIKIIEQNYDVCKDLAAELPFATIINGDGSDPSFLEAENIAEMSAFISLTGHDEDNLVAALFAKEYGVPKVIAKTSRLGLPESIRDSGIDNFVSPKVITANYILQFARGLKNAMGNPVHTLYKIVGGKAEAAEFVVGSLSRLANIPLKDLKLRQGVLVGAIARQNQVIIPHGDDCLRSGDSVILLTRGLIISDLDDVLETGSAL
jgi:trk system potassium uptake protein TrkA